MRRAATARGRGRRTARSRSSSTSTWRSRSGDDTIEATADYRGVTERVRALVEEGSYDLIETMAADIAEACLAEEAVTRASVVVHKPNAAARLAIDGVAAAVTRPAE